MGTNKQSASYKDAGVDLDVYREAMGRLPRLMHRTFSPRVVRHDGGFAGLFQLDFNAGLFRRGYDKPLLVSGSDGVGTKLKVAGLAARHGTIGVDLVAMCVNDVICCGAEPLFFLDYVAMSRDDPSLLEQIVQGISDGCLQADCALLGGETAIMPDVYRDGDYDLAGFCVGVVEKKHLIDGRSIAEGDQLIGLASNGFHSNGYSLVRKVVFDVAGLSVDDTIAETGQSIGDALLAPTRIYAKPVRRLLNHYKVKNVVHGISHITGGGLPENLQRILPKQLDAIVDSNNWPIPPLFPWLQRLGGIDPGEMYRVFNMGIGMVLFVSPYFADSIRRMLEDLGVSNWTIGHVAKGSGIVDCDHV